MARYIDADDLEHDIVQTGLIIHNTITAAAAAYFVNRAPTADVAPVGHGKWAPESDYFVCSLCGNSYDIDEDNLWNYCPNCGAKMNTR